MTNQPAWWNVAKVEIDEIMFGFADALKIKLIRFGDNPMSLLRKKNPFLLRIRSTENVNTFAQNMIKAFLSSSEETRFGSIFEGCAEIVCKYGRNGQKSGIEGIDIEYSENIAKRVLVQIKSGRNWGNASQKKQLKNYFEKASRILKRSTSVKDVRCIERICYGKNEHKHFGNQERIVGSLFWSEISGWDNLYFALMDIIGSHAGNGLSDIENEVTKKIIAFMQNKNLLIDKDKINWNKLLYLLSETD